MKIHFAYDENLEALLLLYGKEHRIVGAAPGAVDLFQMTVASFDEAAALALRNLTKLGVTGRSPTEALTVLTAAGARRMVRAGFGYQFHQPDGGKESWRAFGAVVQAPDEETARRLLVREATERLQGDEPSEDVIAWLTGGKPVEKEEKLDNAPSLDEWCQGAEDAYKEGREARKAALEARKAERAAKADTDATPEKSTRQARRKPAPE